MKKKVYVKITVAVDWYSDGKYYFDPNQVAEAVGLKLKVKAVSLIKKGKT